MKNLLLRQKSYLHIVLIVAVNVVTTAKGMENNEDVSMTVNNEDSSMTSYHAHLEPHIKNLLEGFNYNNRPANSAFLKDVLLINARSSGNPFNRLSTEQQEHVRNCVKKNDLVELRRAFDSYKFSSLDIKNTIFYDSKTQNFHSILHAAVESNAPDVANFLVEKKPYAGQPAEAAGVNVNNTFETHGKAPLAYAAARLNLEALEFLIRKGASIAQEDLSGLNARHYAAYTLHQKARNTDKISAKLLQRYLSIDQQLKQTPISQSPIGQSLKRKDEQQFSYNAKRRPVENTFISKD